jgi:hypothetical protein
MRRIVGSKSIFGRDNPRGGAPEDKRMKLSRSLFVAAIIAGSVPSMAAEEHRELGAHEHGVGRLNIAIEGKRVSMELEVPGADIVGFEHEASTKTQKGAVQKAKTTLTGALNVFKLPAEAKCKVAQAKVEVHTEEKQEQGHDKAGEAKHDAADNGSGHSEFHAEYVVDCAAPEKLTGIDFKYFELFPHAQKLDVNLVTDKGQTHYEVTRETPQLKFGEIG